MSSTTHKLYYVDGKAVWLTDREAEEAGLIAPRRRVGPGIAAGYSEGNPGTSLSMGCHSTQVDLMNDTMKQHGISGVEWDKKGKCIITSRRARARAMPIVGNMLGLGHVFDADGGYRDG